ncbi:MAG: META domain-containing protein [Pyrinomonadaceae bacterium]
MRILLTVLMLLSAMGAMAGMAAAQSLPAGKWQLDEYKFGATTEHPLKGVATTLLIKPNGNLGGNTGCNAYGGSYSGEKGKLAITDIISTMRACDEPTTTFERDFFNTLQSAASANVKGSTLTIKDAKGHYLHFIRSDK